MEVGDVVEAYWDCEKEESSDVEIISIDSEGNPTIETENGEIHSTEIEDGEIFIIPN